MKRPDLLHLLDLHLVQRYIVFLCWALLATATPVRAFDVWTIEPTPQPIDILPAGDRWTLIAVWSLDCIVCEQQKPALSQLHEQIDHVTVIGIAIDGFDSMQSLRQRLADKPVSFENYVVELDEFNHQFRDATGERFLVTPTYVLYNPSGQIVHVQAGPLNFTALTTYLAAQRAALTSTDTTTRSPATRSTGALLSPSVLR